MESELVKHKGFKRSARAFSEAQRVIAGGVNSPARAFGGVGGTPVFIDRAKGSSFTDLDGNRYIDYVLSWGPLILGHAHPAVVKAIREAAARGSSFGAPTLLETRLASLVRSYVPSIQKVRMVNSGTEAAMSAIRLARGYTGRDIVAKFQGNYHGHVDSLLVQAGSSATTLGAPDSPGVPAGFTRTTLNLPYNNLDAVRHVCKRLGRRIACIIVEPVAGNMGVVPPAPGFLEGLRTLSRRYGIVLIFDEVMTGFRVARGGAQELFGVEPDLTTLGKVIGGGLPVGAYGGRADIMDAVLPTGRVFQAGTLSGNPLAMAAGIATLEALRSRSVYRQLEDASAALADGLEAAAHESGISTFHTRVGSMLCTFFSSGPVTDYSSAKRSDTAKYAQFFHATLRRGVYFAPSQFEAAFLSTAHTPRDIEYTVRAARAAFQELRKA